jgi:hypothetical protein
MRFAVGLSLAAMVFGMGVCIGSWNRWRHDAEELAQCHEQARMALDAAAAKAILVEPTPHECAEAARAGMARAGFRAVNLEGVRR